MKTPIKTAGPTHRLAARSLKKTLPFFQKAVLSSKPDGDSKLEELRRQSERLCEQEGLEETRKQQLQQSVRGTEEQWRMALLIVDQALDKAKTQTLLEAFQAQNESVQSWIRALEQSQQSLGGCMQVEEKREAVQVSFSHILQNIFQKNKWSPKEASALSRLL